MKLLFVFEFGLLHYRIPILEQIASSSEVEKVDIIHTDKLSDGTYSFRELKAKVVTIGKVKLLPKVFSIKDDYDIIVFSFNLWRPNWLFNMFSSSKAKCIFWGHGFGRKNDFYLARLAKVYFARRADALLFYTPSGLRDFKKYGIDDKKLFVAMNTLHIDKPVLSESPKTDLIYVGRIQERKGLDVLINAFNLIKDEVGTDINIRIIGQGDISELESLVTKYNLQSSVSFEPAIYDEESLKKLFSTAIAYVSPNHVGLGVTHSFAYGVPVITNKDKKHAPEFEYCNEKNSLLYHGDITALASCIKAVCTDKNLQQALADEAFNYYQKNLKSEVMVRGFSQAFDYVLNHSKAKQLNLA